MDMNRLKAKRQGASETDECESLERETRTGLYGHPPGLCYRDPWDVPDSQAGRKEGKEGPPTKLLLLMSLPTTASSCVSKSKRMGK